MADSSTPAPTDPGPAAHRLDTATVWMSFPSASLRFADVALWALVIRHARCADGSLDAEQWFPVSAQADNTRQEAAAAIAVCGTCQVRAQCLALSLRHWDIGQYGVWGGLVMLREALDQARREPEGGQHR
jgi:hypothetical protein